MLFLFLLVMYYLLSELRGRRLLGHLDASRKLTHKEIVD